MKFRGHGIFPPPPRHTPTLLRSRRLQRPIRRDRLRNHGLPGAAAARSQERATANSRPPPMSYLAFALAAAAAVAEGSAKAITASPSTKLDPGLPPKP